MIYHYICSRGNPGAPGSAEHFRITRQTKGFRSNLRRVKFVQIFILIPLFMSIGPYLMCFENIYGIHCCIYSVR
jgi:hypothetical protein